MSKLKNKDEASINWKKMVVTTILTILLLATVGIAIRNLVSLEKTFGDKGIQLDAKDHSIKELNLKWKTTNEELKEMEENNEASKKRIEELENEKQDLETKLQAKLEQNKKLANVSVSTKVSASSQPVVQTAGNCHSWMDQAGITDKDTAYILIMKESGCRPDAVNPTSGACGIGQQLPCGKWKHQWNDPVGAMIDMQNYVMGRYKSWQNALNFHYANNWY